MCSVYSPLKLHILSPFSQVMWSPRTFTKVWPVLLWLLPVSHTLVFLNFLGPFGFEKTAFSSSSYCWVLYFLVFHRDCSSILKSLLSSKTVFSIISHLMDACHKIYLLLTIHPGFFLSFPWGSPLQNHVPLLSFNNDDVLFPLGTFLCHNFFPLAYSSHPVPSSFFKEGNCSWCQKCEGSIHHLFHSDCCSGPPSAWVRPTRSWVLGTQNCGMD